MSVGKSMHGRAAQVELKRLTMRRARSSDLDAIHEIMSDPETMRYWSTLPHESRKQTAAWLQGMIDSDPEQGDEFVLEYMGKVIGKLGAWRLPEIGFFLHRSYWGKGLAGEALSGFIAYMISRGVPLLTVDVDPLNLASLKLLTSNGFRETGRAQATFVVGDRICDSVYLARHLDQA